MDKTGKSWHKQDQNGWKWTCGMADTLWNKEILYLYGQHIVDLKYLLKIYYQCVALYFLLFFHYVVKALLISNEIKLDVYQMLKTPSILNTVI